MYNNGDRVLIVRNVDNPKYDRYIRTVGTVIEIVDGSWLITMYDGQDLYWYEKEIQKLSELGKAIYE